MGQKITNYLQKLLTPILILTLTFILNFSLSPLASAATFGDFETTGSAFILYNANEKRILAAENPDNSLPIASLTKLMVATVILENSDLKLTDEITITPEMLYDLAEWSAVGLAVNDVATVENLLYALLLPSAGDAGQALAIADSGSIEKFAEKMNKKAAELNLKNSHFTNPIGRDTDNYSTPRDVATLLFHSLKNPTFVKIFSADAYNFTPLNKTIKKTTTTYGLDTSIITGSKTGFTNAAGRCLASTSTLNGVDYLYVTLGHNPSTSTHISDTLEVYNYFNENYSYRTILEQNQPLLKIPITDASLPEYNLTAPETATYYLENAYDLSELDIFITHPETINRYTDPSAPIAHLVIKKHPSELELSQIALNDDSNDATSELIIYEIDLYISEPIEFNNHIPLIIILSAISLVLLLTAFFLPSRRNHKSLKHYRLIKLALFAIFSIAFSAFALYIYNLYSLPAPETITTKISLQS